MSAPVILALMSFCFLFFGYIFGGEGGGATRDANTGAALAVADRAQGPGDTCET